MKRKTWIGLALLVLIGGMTGAFIWKETGAGADPVQTARAQTRMMRESVTTSGTLEPRKQEKIYAGARQGELDEVTVEEGEKVEKGDLLLKYENPWSRVKAGMNGTVIQRRPAHQGEATDQPLLVIADLKTLVVTAEVSEFDALKVKKGQQVTIQSDAVPDREWAGEVAKIAYLPTSGEVREGEDEQVMYPVKIRLQEKLPLKLGSRLMVEIRTPGKKVLSLPQEAVVRKGEKTLVYRVEKGRTAVREVELGISDGKRVEIRSGLDQKDEVVADPPADMTAGMEVNGR